MLPIIPAAFAVVNNLEKNVVEHVPPYSLRQIAKDIGLSIREFLGER